MGLPGSKFSCVGMLIGQKGDLYLLIPILFRHGFISLECVLGTSMLFRWACRMHQQVTGSQGQTWSEEEGSTGVNKTGDTENEDPSPHFPGCGHISTKRPNQTVLAVL